MTPLTGPAGGEGCGHGDLLKIFAKADVMIKKEVKSKIIDEYKTHDGDTGSAEVQIAILTNRTTNSTEHLRIHKER